MKVLILLLFCTGMVQAGEKIVWNGTDIGKSSNWKTNGTFAVDNGVAQIHLTGTKWSGVGLNWAGYWPATAGTKMDDYKFFVVWMKVEGKADGLCFNLMDNKKKKSASVAVKDYVEGGVMPTVLTKVKIPIEKFKGDKSQLQSGVIWELMVSCWSPNEKDIKVSIDKIAFADE